MDIKVETEEKYYCLEPERLIRLAESLGFKLKEETCETDEYFTDINSEFIKNRTCLRIRKQSNDTMEITFKGKSYSLTGQYCKMENNIEAYIKEYDNYINLFASLGYYSYVEVVKNRINYTRKDNKYIYNIMIDKIPEIGGFVEFEIISKKDTFQTKELKKTFQSFISKFKTICLKEADKPYRDIVAYHIYTHLIGKKDIKNICINLDCAFSKYEKDFFNQYKDRIEETIHTKIKWRNYKYDDSIEKKISPFIKNYINHLVLYDRSLLTTIELLNKLDTNVYFFTTISPSFITQLFSNFKIKYKQILYVNHDTLKKQLVKQQISIKDTMIINEKSLKLINSHLLIFMNHQK